MIKTICSILVLIMSLPGFSAAEKFCVIQIPDTQGETQSYPGVFNGRMQWIADNKTTHNIRFVVQVGDLVQWDQPEGYPLSNPREAHYMYNNADTGFDILDAAGIPYAIAVGNHDTAACGGTDTGDWTGNCTYDAGAVGCGEPWINIRITDTFNLPQYFPPSRFPNLAGVFEEGKSDNCYHTFSAGGTDWLVLSNELNPRNEAFNWAKEVVASHPNHNVIYLTHSFIDQSSNEPVISGIQGYCGDDTCASPAEVRDQLIKVYPNIKMVLCGHAGAAINMEITGNSGNKVYCFLMNLQDGGNGRSWTRKVEIDTSAGTIDSYVFDTVFGTEWIWSPTNTTYTGVTFVPPAAGEVDNSSDDDPVPPADDAGISFENLKVFGNVLSENNSGVRFEGLETGMTLKIFTLSGTLVTTLNESDFSGGTIDWTGLNTAREEVKPGIYIYVLTDSLGGRRAGKIVVKG